MIPVPGMTVTPLNWDKFQDPMWFGFVSFAIENPEFQDLFEQDTGHDLRQLVGRSAIEQMIDEATGRERVMLLAFLDWVTKEYWGVADGS